MREHDLIGQFQAMADNELRVVRRDLETGIGLMRRTSPMYAPATAYLTAITAELDRRARQTRPQGRLPPGCPAEVLTDLLHPSSDPCRAVSRAAEAQLRTLTATAPLDTANLDLLDALLIARDGLLSGAQDSGMARRVSQHGTGVGGSAE